MVLTQIGINIFEWAVGKFFIGLKIKKVKAYFEQKTE